MFADQSPPSVLQDDNNVAREQQDLLELIEQQDSRSDMIPFEIERVRNQHYFTSVRRRSSRLIHVLWVLPLIVVAVFFVKNCEETCNNISVASASSSRRVIAGFDPSEANGALRQNVQYKDMNGNVKDPLVIFKEHGYQWTRIRVMVDPSGSYGLFQDLAYVKTMALQAHTLGFKLLLDFHYSHWWADPDNQWIPNNWKASNHNDPNNVSVAILEQHVYNHTSIVMQALVGQGTPPDAVQIGNEVNQGILWKAALVTTDGDTNWKNLVRITNAAVKAIENAVVNIADDHNEDEDEEKNKDDHSSIMPKIVMHLASGGDTQFTQTWLNKFIAAGGVFDIIGLSYYPMWHGTFDDLQGNLENLNTVFPSKQVWVVETAYYWGETGEKTLPYPTTPEGQVDFLTALRSVLEDYGRDTVVFYWGSHWTQPEKWMNATENWGDAAKRSLFDSDARALKSIAVLPGTIDEETKCWCRL